MLIDMTKDIEKKAGAASPPEPAPLTDADANSSIHTSGSNNDRYTLIAGRNHGALMTCASLFLPGRGVGQAAHSVGVARGRLQSCLAHQARVRSHKSEPFGFGERDVDAVIGGVIECQRALFLDDPFDGNAGIDDQIAHRFVTCLAEQNLSGRVPPTARQLAELGRQIVETRFRLTGKRLTQYLRDARPRPSGHAVPPAV